MLYVQEESNIVGEKMTKNAMKFNKIVVKKVKTKNTGSTQDRFVFYNAVMLNDQSSF